jgi:hypothetical protein
MRWAEQLRVAEAARSNGFSLPLPAGRRPARQLYTLYTKILRV